MKTNLFKRTLSFVIVACMLIAMVAVAPMASAAEVPALTFGMDVYEYDNKGTAEVRVSIYMTGYDQWNFETEGIDMLQFRVNFDNTKLNFVTSLGGSGEYKAFTAPNGMTVTASNKNSAQAANENGYVAFMTEAGVGEDEETGESYALYIPQGEKVYLRTYTFTVKEGATGDCNFSYTTDYFFVTDFFHGMKKIVVKDLPATWTANGGTYTIAPAQPEYNVEVVFKGEDLLGTGVTISGIMDPIKGVDEVVLPEPTYTVPAGFVFQGWLNAETFELYQVGDKVTSNATFYPYYAEPAVDVTYNANGGSGKMNMSSGTASMLPTVSGNKFTAPAGYSFKEWNTAADGTGTAYAKGDTVKETTTLYAIWVANKTSDVANFYKMIGAQARTAESGKSAGMRFGVNIAGLVAGVEIQDKGILMIPTDLLNGAELTHDTPNYAIGTFNAAWNENGEEIYTAVLVNIPEGQYARPITARGFVKVNGVYYYTPAIERNYQAVLDTLSAMQ